MAGGCGWSRRGAVRMRALRGLVRGTQRACRDLADVLCVDPEVSNTVSDIGQAVTRPTVLVVLGTSYSAKARLLHALLGRRLMPDVEPRSCRWLRIQFGSATAVHLSLGNSEFELVEELVSNRGEPWETLPAEDLLRPEGTDQGTVLEVELNNQFLKDGLKIIIPPDFDTGDPCATLDELKTAQSELYSKRDVIIRTFNAIFLYAIDRIGKIVFSQAFCDPSMTTSRSEEDFWNNYSLYFTCAVKSVDRSEQECDKKTVIVKQEKGEPAVFDTKNCLDLHQVKQINPSAEIFFVLLSDSVDVEAGGGSDRFYDATESMPESDQHLAGLRPTTESPERIKDNPSNVRLYEEQCAFMNELLDQWELSVAPPSKTLVKSQWLILDDHAILRSAALKGLATPSSNAAHNAKETSSQGASKANDRVVKNRANLINKIIKFASDSLQNYILGYATKLSEIHVKLVQQFILASFDLARELQVVPKKIQYVAQKEQQLYETVSEKFSEGDKKQELLQIMQDVLQEMRSEITNMDWSVDDLPCHADKRFVVSNSTFYQSRDTESASFRLQPTPVATNRFGPRQFGLNRNLSGINDSVIDEDDDSDVEEAVNFDSFNIDDYEVIESNDESLTFNSWNRDFRRYMGDAPSPEESQRIPVANESVFSVNSSAVWSEFRSLLGSTSTGAKCNNDTQISIKQASLDVQKTVLSKLSKKISLKLIKFVDCLRDSYFGTLQRCLESLESSCRQELGGRPASEAMRQLLAVARQVDLQGCASFSSLRTLLESVRRLFHRLRIVSGATDGACCVLSPVWRRQVALHTAHSLSPQRLAKFISTQICEKLTVSHERYQSALASLETALAARLHHTEDVKLAIRKKYAPCFARLCLESTSMCDLLLYGTPELGREIGRGQYGVVYAVRGAWAGHAPAAVKSVLPADERHYNELAMEFFYTRSIPAHPRIVRLYGSIVELHNATPSVLLISERKTRDLHAAVRAGLAFRQAVEVALDIVDGIRYLHSLGLVHRDIKMKNVLLDEKNRAALTDLGFLAAEALMSGSVVGTPVHMAPELHHGDYDANVDVYAFGILFWYLCAGDVKLPAAFEAFQNKEQLWTKVRRGLRPERLPHFTDDCWAIMQSCWAPNPNTRALLGDVHIQLSRVREQTVRAEAAVDNAHLTVIADNDCDSLNMSDM